MVRENIYRCFLKRMLVDSGIVEAGAYNKALYEKRRTGRPIGEILVNDGVIGKAELDIILAIRDSLTHINDALCLIAGERLLIGEILTIAERVTGEDINAALREQRRTGGKIGEVLIRQELIAEPELRVALEYQRRQGLPSQQSRLRLGELLVATGKITRRHLEDALEKQRLAPHKKIGEILVEDGHLEHHQVVHAHSLQRKLIAAVLVAIFSLVYPHVDSEASTLRSAISITTHVVDNMEIRTVFQASTVTVGASDILQGYVDVPSATQIEVKSSRTVLLNFSTPAAPFKEAYVKGVGGETIITAGGGSVFVPDTHGLTVLELSYRFALDKNANPGTYNWPISVSISSG